jgi:hypothetical protein
MPRQISMATWKHYIILFGGFHDPGIMSGFNGSLFTSFSLHVSVAARYLNDLWVFDTHEYKWMQVEFRETDSKPS